MSLPTSNDYSESLATPSQPPSISVPNLETARLSVALPRNDDDNDIQPATISELAPSLKTVKLSLDLAEEVLMKRHKLREKGIEQSEIDLLIPPTFVSDNVRKSSQKKRPESSDDSVSSVSSESTQN